MTTLLPDAKPAARPRVCSVPPYVSSAGLEVVELSASAGLQLDPWQAQDLTDALGERQDGRWASFEVAEIVPRQNGKGAIGEARVLGGLFLFHERLLLWTAHEYKTAMEAFRRVLSHIDNTDDLRKRVKRVSNTNGDEGIELRNGQRLRFIARSKGSGRGFSADCVIWDEAYALTPEQVAAQLPTMSARPNPQIWYMSSPPLDAVSGAVLIGVRNRGIEGAPALCYLDYGCERGADLDDRDNWRSANPGYDIRVTEEFVERERAAMSDEDFGRERLGIWPPTSSEAWQVIPEADWNAAFDPKSQPVDPVAFAIDVTPDRSWASIAVAGLRADGLRHVEVIDHRPGTGWILQRARDLVERWKPCALVVDPAGPSGSLIASFAAAGLEVITPSMREAAQACGQFYDGMSGELEPDPAEMPDEPVERPNPRNIRHTGQAELGTALAGAVKRPLGDAWAWDRKSVSIDISPLVAATNALWGHAAYAHLFADYSVLDSVR